MSICFWVQNVRRQRNWATFYTLGVLMLSQLKEQAPLWKKIKGQ